MTVLLTNREIARGNLVAALALSLAAISLGACGSESDTGSPESSQPQPPPAAAGIDPTNFVRRVDNPYLPLGPGTTYQHRGVKEGKRAVDVFAVTHRTKRILGVPTTVVDDKLYVDGRLEEIAHDWYTQDRQGNVWYFGETIEEFDPKGKQIPAKGAWQAGVNGARPGIVMPAQPKVGDTFRPEYYKGVAEDVYRILDLSARVSVPYRSFTNVLVMSEQSHSGQASSGSSTTLPDLGRSRSPSLRGLTRHWASCRSPAGTRARETR